MINQLVLTVTVLSFVLVACKPRSNSNDTKLKVVGGEVAKEGAFPASFYIPSCSAVRVSDRHFLTAAHCVLKKPQWQVLDYFKSGAELPIRVGVELSSAKGYVAKVKQVKVHRSYKESTDFGGDLDLASVVDIALVELDRLPKEVAVAKLSDTPINAGSKVVFTGYGCEVIPAFMRRQSGLDFVASGELDEDEKKLRFKFKEVSVLDLEDNVAMIANIHPQDNIFTRQQDHDQFSGCPGDSGSAVYRVSDSKTTEFLEVLGINSYVNHFRSVFARLDKQAPNGLATCLQETLSSSKNLPADKDCFEKM
jgi:hypothetical protein